MNLPFFNFINKFLSFKPVINKPMRTSHSGIELIKRYEGFRPEPYLDAVGVPTIGYGFTYYPNGKKVTMNDNPISTSFALELLKEIVKPFENVVNSVSENLNQNQFDALVSFSYNVGIGALTKSTLAKKVKVNPKDESISYEFSRWNKAGGRVLAGLTRRRKEEAELYFS